MVTRADEPRIEAFERRAIWLAALATVGLAFGGFGLGFSGGAEAWKIALYVASQAALVGSVGLAALSLAPGRASVVRIERVIFWAFVLFWLGLLLTSVIASVSAIQSIGDSSY